MVRIRGAVPCMHPVTPRCPQVFACGQSSADLRPVNDAHARARGAGVGRDGPFLDLFNFYFVTVHGTCSIVGSHQCLSAYYQHLSLSLFSISCLSFDLRLLTSSLTIISTLSGSISVPSLIPNLSSIASLSSRSIS